MPAGVFLLAAFALAVPARAQEPPAVMLVAKGGLVNATLVYSGEGDFFDSSNRWTAGVEAGFPKIGIFGVSLSVEALYVRKGAVDAAGGVQGERLRLDWIEIPVLARINAGRVGGARLFGIVGPAFDLRLRADFAGFDVAEQYESTALNLVAGAGVSFGRWSVEGRVSQGFTNLPTGFAGETLKDRSVFVLGGFRVR